MSKNTFKKLRWAYFAVPLVAFSIFLGCKHEAQNAPAGKNYSGEALFRGILFKQGEVAEKIPMVNQLSANLSNLPAEQKIRLAKFNDEIVNKIKEKNPKFLDWFKKKIESGDQIQIQFALQEASKAIVNSVNEFPEFQKELGRAKVLAKQIDVSAIKNSDGSINKSKLDAAILALKAKGQQTNSLTTMDTESTAVVLVIALVVYVAVAVDVVIVVNVAVAVGGYLYLALYGPGVKNSSAKTTSVTSLANQMLTNQIAQKLSAY